MAKIQWTHVVEESGQERWSTLIDDTVTDRSIVATFHPIYRVRQSETEGTFTAWIDWGIGKAPERPHKPLKDRVAAKCWCERRLKAYLD